MQEKTTTSSTAETTSSSRLGKGRWICPITQACTKGKLHRKCTGEGNGRGVPCEGEDCWDCCNDCHIACIEPPKDAVDYDLPEGETW